MDIQELSIDGIKEYLMKEGINPSYQRLKILEYLLKYRIHPTVDTIYNDLSKQIPTLSKTTVYNTLNLFQERDIITSLTIEKNEARYESSTKPHAHFKCTECGNIYDILIKFPHVSGNTIDGHVVTEQQLYLKGICKNCTNRV